jgi:hypothetical protein
VFAVMDNKSVSVNGSRCLILYMNVVVLLIKILNTIQNELLATFVSLGVFLHCTILALSLPCRFAESYGLSILSLSKSKLNPWEWSQVPWNGVECLGMQPNALECNRVPPSLKLSFALLHISTLFLYRI